MYPGLRVDRGFRIGLPKPRVGGLSTPLVGANRDGRTVTSRLCMSGFLQSARRSSETEPAGLVVPSWSAPENVQTHPDLGPNEEAQRSVAD
jgi:hypothetical protein